MAMFPASHFRMSILFELEGKKSRRHRRGAGLILLVLVLGLSSGCSCRWVCARPVNEEGRVRVRLMEILRAAEAKELVRLDSYHWYGPHFTKFGTTGVRQDATAARDGEHRGLSAVTGLKLRADDVKVDVFQHTAVATFIMVATVPAGSQAVTKSERGTLVFVKHEGAWKIVHEHFSAAE